MKLAFVYDRLNKIGGAERVLEALHEMWPQAPFYTAVYDPSNAAFAKSWDIRPSFLQKVPFAKNHHEWFAWAAPFAFESFNFNEFDLVISITSAEAKGIITKPETLHICYCLTPTRYLWSHTAQYQQSGNPLLKPIRKLLLTKLRMWDQIASTRPDHYLAISETAQNRIEKYYHRDSEVIYPGIDTNFFLPSSANSQPPNAKGYFLVVSRLVPYKRVDLAIQACNELHRTLKIIGTGSDMHRLRKAAGPTIEFLGQLTDDETLEYYQGCQALIFPGEEDLGLTILEALSCGKPVIAYKGGGAKELIEEGTTGAFFGTLSPHSLAQALQHFDPDKFTPSIIRQKALRWSQDTFISIFKRKIENLWQQHQQNLP